MSSLALMLGLFAVPLAMLGTCHRFRRRSARQRRMLWGMVLGYGASLLVMLLVSLVPPVMWVPGEGLRAFLVYWSLLLFPAIGAMLAHASAPRGSSTRPL